LINFNIALII